jgi:hypothetical protein
MRGQFAQHFQGGPFRIQMCDSPDEAQDKFVIDRPWQNELSQIVDPNWMKIL